MPSLFPGIDPYIEAQGYWGDFHPSFVTYCRDSLNELLTGKLCRPARRTGSPGRSAPRESRRIIPDVAILGGSGEPGHARGVRSRRAGP